MPITKLTPETSYPYLQDRLKQLEQVVPEAFADGKINWDTLREVLGESLEEGGCDEYFGLNWPGKREARKRAATPSHGTLVPAPGEGVNEDTTENLFIEGDNLEVLKLLQKSYAGKIKMIYIDPPYNTGNDFIYNDDFTDPLAEYLKYTGAIGESGELLTTNTHADGRFHSNWLNMMYPRLILARQLLRDDGIIFISIDDNEVQNLRQMMNEIYGEENFVECIVWKKKTGAGAKTNGFIKLHEYILCYIKNFSGISSIESPLSEKIKKTYNKKDEYFDELGPYATWPLDTTSMDSRPNLRYPILYNGIEIWPQKQWLWSKEKVEKAQKENKLVFNYDDKNKKYHVRFKGYLLDETGAIKSGTPISLFEGPYTQEGTKDFQKFFARDIFPFPKPVQLIKNLLNLSVNSNPNEKDIILDFFSGSCTTAQAVIEQTLQDLSNREFIMIQFPEKTGNTEFPTIAEIGKERIRRVIKENEKELLKKAEKAPLLQEDQPKPDLGFKVSRFNHSNFKQWKVLQEESIDTVTPLFDDHRDSLVQGWKKEDLLSEIFLLEGYPLTSKVAYLEDHLQNQVYRVTAPDFCDHDLFVCLDETIQPVTVDLLKMEKEDIFICLDSALSDELKARVKDKFQVHVI